MSILTAYSLLQSDSINNMFALYTKWIDIMYNGSNIDEVLPEFRDYPSLFTPRMTGVSCYNSLKNASRNINLPPNNSRGNGAIMRIAPVGLVCSDPIKALTFGMNISLLTHGHPIAYIAAGLFASIISTVFNFSNRTIIRIIKKTQAIKDF
ncbi:MAG: ADP-ribosylglycohydrolase family protein [Brevinema sp.]